MSISFKSSGLLGVLDPRRHNSIDRNNEKQILIQNQVEKSQEGNCLCYTVLNGEYYIDANGYWSTNTNFQENKISF